MIGSGSLAPAAGLLLATLATGAMSCHTLIPSDDARPGVLPETTVAPG